MFITLGRFADSARRSVYGFIDRQNLPNMFRSFDVASPDIPIAQRSVTTVAPQALILLNSDFMQQQATALAERARPVTRPSMYSTPSEMALRRKPCNKPFGSHQPSRSE